MGTVIAAMIFSGCSKDDDLDQSFYDASSKQSSESLTGQELEGLLYMAEKQKLQRDVYMGMYERTLNPVFNELYLTDRNNLHHGIGFVYLFGNNSSFRDPVRIFRKKKPSLVEHCKLIKEVRYE